MDVATVIGGVANFLGAILWDDAGGGDQNTKFIRWGAGILAVIILVILIQRRRTKVK